MATAKAPPNEAGAPPNETGAPPGASAGPLDRTAAMRWVFSAFAAVPTSNSMGVHSASGRLGAGSGRLRAYAVSGSVSLLASPASDRDTEEGDLPL